MSEFTDTGIPWVGDIPRDWGMFPLFSIARENKKKNKEKNDNVLSLSYGRIIRRDLSRNFGLLPDSFDGYQVVDDGYIIIRSTDLQNDKKSLRVGLVHEYGVITSAYIGLSPSNNIHPNYLFYYLNMCDLKKVFYSLGGGLRQSLRFEEFRRFPIVVPPTEEQKLISRYLDKKTEQIDRLDMKIKKKIELLKEQRTSLINQCVTKGLDPHVEMKDSGVEWIGEIPKNWTMIKLNILSENISNGTTSTQIDNSAFPVSRIETISGGVINPVKIGYIENSNSKLDSFLLNDGDILLSHINSLEIVGQCAVYNKDTHGTLYHGMNLLRIVTKRNLCDPLYLHNFLKSSFARYFIRLVSKRAIGQVSVSIQNLCELKIPIPKVLDQEIINSHLDIELNKIDYLENLEVHRLSLLKEYRQSLISSAVTGKFRITEDMV